MTALHAYFNLRQQQSFQRALDGIRGQSQAYASPSTSGGKSWSKPSAFTSGTNLDVNARDWLGRTVLHLACASSEPSSLEYVRLLLAHSAVNVNLPDAESHWTALHRALFHGNIGAAILLLKRPDIDTALKDHEGYTAFDLYNSTIASTKPASWSKHEDPHPAELFTWGANRNAALGHGDSHDKAYADQVIIPPLQNAQNQIHDFSRFESVKVKQVVMSRLHTVVVTDEPRSNLRVCGFGSGGRLGPTHHTQYNLTPFPPAALPHTITSVALGQDHTLAVTKVGEVLSWGLNRFSQLGYIIEAPAASAIAPAEELLIQATPKKVFGVLKKELVRGVAACKTASACWTPAGDVYTWGTNGGQLGYDKAAQPVQVLPRKVTKIAVPVISIAMNETAMACLLSTQDVVCIMNDRHFKINFPVHAFPSEMHVYRPPQALRDANIAKITSCDDTFAALSSNGEVFTFAVPGSSDTSDSRTAIKPQRVWALRKQFSGVRDVALGADGSLIVATQSGHVFVRSRNPKSSQSGSGTASKAFKFQRIPYLQRVVSVCANNTGAFGALRVDCHVEKALPDRESTGFGMEGIQPFLNIIRSEEDINHTLNGPALQAEMIFKELDEEDPTDVPIQKDIFDLKRLLHIISRKSQIERDEIHLTHGADVIVQTSSGSQFPAHCVWLAARCSVLQDVLDGKKAIKDAESKITLRMMNVSANSAHPTLPRLACHGCSAISILILLAYLYTDDLLCLWDPRVLVTLKQHLLPLGINPAQVKIELQALTRILDLPKLAEAVQAPGKRSPLIYMEADMQRLCAEAQKHGMTQIMAKSLVRNSLCPDVIIQLRDKEFFCHSAILRARSSFFAAFFDDEDWTAKRWDEHGVIKVDMKHWDWRVMQFPLHFLLGGLERVEETLNSLDSVHTSLQAIEFLFEIIGAANELLLFRLVHICSNIVLNHLDITNACYILSDATHYQTKTLITSLHMYLATNMETMLEGRMCEDLTPLLIKQLGEFVRKQQAEKFVITRSTFVYDRALHKYGDWLLLQDISCPIAPGPRLSLSKDPRLSPPGPSRRNRRTLGIDASPVSPTTRPLAPIHPVHRVPSEGEMFLMDETDHATTSEIRDEASTPNAPHTGQESEAPPTPGTVWTRRPSAYKVDMKTIMAEAAGTKPADLKVYSPYRSTTSERAPQRERRKMQWANPTTPPENSVVDLPRLNSSPWKQTGNPSPVSSSTLALPSSSAPTASSEPAPSSPDHKRQAEAKAAPASSVAPRLPATPPRPQPQTGLGPVFSPTRQLSSANASPSTGRRVPSGGVAWTLPPVQPVVESSTSAPVSGPSFVAIQQMQLDQGPALVTDKRSLLQIQEEEQSRQAEADFLRWWNAEEERVKQEEEAQIAALLHSTGSQSKQSIKPRNTKRHFMGRYVTTTNGDGAGASSPQPERTEEARQPNRLSKPKASKRNRAKPNAT